MCFAPGSSCCQRTLDAVDRTHGRYDASHGQPAAVSALCWSGGLLIGALGVMLHQLWLLLLGPGIIGGIELGLGYISPVSTLIKWFPDRRGMATGLAIMGFGGGAMIGAPLADILINAFRSPTSVGAWQALLTLSAVYLMLMLAGAFGYRLPPKDWRAAIGAGFTGLLSLFNIGGRLFWASLSDKIGRKATYRAFFALGILFYAAAPSMAHTGNTALFVGILCIIRRSLRDRARLSCRHLWDAVRQRHSRARADRLVYRRRHRSCAGQLPARIPDRSRRSARQRL